MWLGVCLLVCTWVAWYEVVRGGSVASDQWHDC